MVQARQRVVLGQNDALAGDAPFPGDAGAGGLEQVLPEMSLKHVCTTWVCRYGGNGIPDAGNSTCKRVEAERGEPRTGKEREF